MVSTENEEVFRVLDLVGQQKADGLKRLLASINIVTKEQIVCFGWEAAIFKETEEIVVLAVNVTADL